MDIVSERIDDIKENEFDKAEVEKAFDILTSNDFGFVAMGSVLGERDKDMSFALASNLGTYEQGENFFLGLVSLLQNLGAKEKLSKGEMFSKQVSVLCSIYGIDFKVVSGLADIVSDKKGAVVSMDKNSVLN